MLNCYLFFCLFACCFLDSALCTFLSDFLSDTSLLFMFFTPLWIELRKHHFLSSYNLKCMTVQSYNLVKKLHICIFILLFYKMWYHNHVFKFPTELLITNLSSYEHRFCALHTLSFYMTQLLFFPQPLTHLRIIHILK